MEVAVGQFSIKWHTKVQQISFDQSFMTDLLKPINLSQSTWTHMIMPPCHKLNFKIILGVWIHVVMLTFFDPKLSNFSQSQSLILFICQNMFMWISLVTVNFYSKLSRFDRFNSQCHASSRSQFGCLSLYPLRREDAKKINLNVSRRCDVCDENCQIPCSFRKSYWMEVWGLWSVAPGMLRSCRAKFS